MKWGNLFRKRTPPPTTPPVAKGVKEVPFSYPLTLPQLDEYTRFAWIYEDETKRQEDRGWTYILEDEMKLIYRSEHQPLVLMGRRKSVPVVARRA